MKSTMNRIAWGRASQATLAVLLVGAAAGGAWAQGYDAAFKANRAAAEQAARDRAQADRAAQEMNRIRSQREADEAARRRSETSRPNSTGAGTQSGSGSSGSGSSPAGPGSTPVPTVDLSPWTRWDLNSPYINSLNPNPPAGQGVVGDWRYDVKHDTNGRYVSGTISTSARDSRSGPPIPVIIGCDFGPSGVDDGSPFFMTVDHRAASQARRSVPSRLVMLAGDASRNLSTSTEELAMWTVGEASSRARGDALRSSLTSGLTLKKLRVAVIYGGWSDYAEASLSDEGFLKAFEKLVPCWRKYWDLEYEARKRSGGSQGAAAGVPALAARDAPGAPAAPVGSGSLQRTGIQPAPSTGRWELVYSVDGANFFVDKGSIARNGDTVSVWALRDKLASGVASTKQLWELRCSELKYRVSYMETYSGTMATGNRIGALRTADAAWTQLNPNSAGAKVVRAVC